MKKVFLAMALALMSVINASAQFEKGKIYGGASLSGLGVSYSDNTKFAFGINAIAGYMIEKDWLLNGQVGFDYKNSNTQDLHFGVGGRYYIEQNGIFLGLGAKYIHRYSNYNDFQFTPEVGWAFFLNHNVMLEPSVYFDMSCSDFSHKSAFGIKVGLGFYF